MPYHTADKPMRQVTRDEFYAHVGPMDVHPHSGPDHCIWETPSRKVIGRTTPGYKCGGNKTYFLVAE